MFSKIKEILSILVPLILVACFFYTCGYYYYFNTPISNYLSIEDFVLLFFKDNRPIYTGIIFFLSFYFTKTIENNPISPKKRKKINSCNSLIFIFGVICLFKLPSWIDSTFERNTLALVLYSVFFLFYMVFQIIPAFDKKTELTKIEQKTWRSLVSIFMIFFVAIPFFIGYKYVAACYNAPNVNITFIDNKLIQCNSDTKNVFIGKTKDYIFIYNSISQTTSICKALDIKSIELLRKEYGFSIINSYKYYYPLVRTWYLRTLSIILLLLIYLSPFLKALWYKYKNRLRFPDKANYFFIFNEIFLRGDYNKVLPKKKEKTRIFDIGGNIGLYTLYLNSNYDNLEIHVFEPAPTIYSYLNHNVTSNKKNSNDITLNCLGLSDTETEREINYFPKVSGLTTLDNDLKNRINETIELKYRNAKCPWLFKQFLRLLAGYYYKSIKEPVKLIRLSDYINSHNIDCIDIVKIDVEGHELNVLKGIEDDHFAIINSFIIEIENFSTHSRNEIESILHKHTYHTSIERENQPCSIITAIKNDPTVTIH